ncbi:ABC transporter substrate-binding protein [Caldinitratiruptor microaerophilus]|uniref:Amino acid ABC transporter substrate-binding protein n=1 Tax=Caldinitratiruptor microaerophilus TaxID=671077 RepID=A0AA35G9N3_9FIRM|nr:ABC transporter substrate-binding protein [Caldinitratiruptor microaerophilus]BDG62375.1 amino acid ABC transporter substrate-binding protein [Caldinitratiruptor microaerophilus]
MQRKARTTAVSLLAAAAMLVLAACGKGPAPAPGAQGGSTPAQPSQQAGGAAAEVKEVRIGAIYPVTGTSAVAGTDLSNGVKLAAEIINGEFPDLNLPLAKTKGLPGLGGAQVKVIFADHQADPNKGKAEAERLVTQEKVAALFGAYNSSVTGAIAPVAERYQIPFLNAESSSPTLTELGFKWFFRTTPHDGIFAENFFQFLEDLKKQGKLQNPTIALVNENGLFGQDATKQEKKYAEQYGYQIVEEIAYSAKATNVTAEVQRLKAKQPDVIFHASYGPDAILYMKTYKEFDLAPKIILAQDAGFVDSQFLKNLGKDGEYVFSREVWSLDLAKNNPQIAKVNDMYKERFGTDMNGNSARAFTGLLVLADAINRAGSTEPEKIRQALQETRIGPEQLIMPWKGVQFDEKGQNTLGTGIIVQVQNQKYVTVWPFDLASAEPIVPMPAWSQR